MAGSMLLGEVLGPVGAIGGAIGGALAGSRAGAKASDGVCSAVESTSDSLCAECKSAANSRPAGQTNWGGGRLGDSSGDTDQSQPPANTPQGERTVGDRVGEAASCAGQRLSEAGAAVGDGLSGAASWVKRSFSSVTGSVPAEDAPKAKSSGAFVPFGGGGHVLGSTALNLSQGSQQSAAPPPRPAAAPSAAGTCDAASPQGPSQLDKDEALARQLQEQFDIEDRPRQSGR
jgi:hypothetical protein